MCIVSFSQYEHPQDRDPSGDLVGLDQWRCQIASDSGRGVNIGIIKRVEAHTSNPSASRVSYWNPRRKMADLNPAAAFTALK